MEGLAILKLGGSVITDKRKPMTPNLKALDALSKCIAQVHLPLVLIHGGGSYGHYYAQQFGLGTTMKKVVEEGVSKTRIAMLELNLIVIRSLEKNRVHTYSLPPASFIRSGHVAENGLALLESILRSDLIPITYGDVLSHYSGCKVVSGDRIARILAECLKPSRVIFTLDVDGLYESNSPPYQIIKEIRVGDRFKIDSPIMTADVTGGIALKLREARRIAQLGIDVYFVSGFKPERVMKALKGEVTYGSLIKGIQSAGKSRKRFKRKGNHHETEVGGHQYPFKGKSGGKEDHNIS